jgi:hypothetical protein
MTRDKFLFADSARLYTQAESLASFLSDSYFKDEGPFRETAKILQEAGISRLTNLSAREAAAELAWNHLKALASGLDSRYVIPGLLETTEQYYYGAGKLKEDVSWLGTALKTSLSVAWGNRGIVKASSKAQTQVRRMIAAAGAWEQLNLEIHQAKAFEFGPVEFTEYGLKYDREEDIHICLEWNNSASKRGLSHRTLEDSKNVIWNNLPLFLEAVSDVLDGQLPTRINLFHGTVFENIELSPEFWLGLALRIKLMIWATQIRSAGRGLGVTGISIFESFGIITSLLGSDESKFNDMIQKMFWQPYWFKPRFSKRDFLSNMVVERPVLRIDNKTFVVGISNIGDSINCFVEHSVFRYLGYGGVPVSEKVFQRHVSQPFESRVCKCFTDLGWEAGQVLENGKWSKVILNHARDELMPGEIDVLAISPDKKIAIIVECKVLASPFEANKLLNLRQKLGPVDSESFHSKLIKKANWLNGVVQLKGLTIFPLLVLDEGRFIGFNAPNVILNIVDLPLAIDWFLREGHKY